MTTALIDNFKTPDLTIAQLQQRAPAAFAITPYNNTSPTYRFISTERIIHTLMEAGLTAVEARQSNSRGDRSNYARHMLRFRSTRLPIVTNDIMQQIVLINSHDATSAYEMRAGIYRTICMNGLLVRAGDFGVIRVSHRGNVLDNIVQAAHALITGFPAITDMIELMRDAILTEQQRITFAEKAYAIRFHHFDPKPLIGMQQLLEPRREADQGDDLWRVYNRVQENVMRGGLNYIKHNNRAAHTRGIRAIREDVRINNALWGEAVTTLTHL